MATKYVWSGASGSNDGSSWANAWTSLASSNNVAAGDIVKIHKTHSQTGLSSTILWAFGTVTNPVRLICVDKDNGDALSTGASIQWTSSTTGPSGAIYAYGITFSNTSNALNVTVNGHAVYESCTFIVGGTQGLTFGGTNVACTFINVTLDLSAASSSSTGFRSFPAKLDWIGGQYICRTGGQAYLFTLTTWPWICNIRGVEFIGSVSSLVNSGGTATGEINLYDCLLPTYSTLNGGEGTNYAWKFSLERCKTGTLTAAALSPDHYRGRGGAITAILSRYRTGGAEDGSQATPYCWEVAAGTTAPNIIAPLACPPIARWVEPGSQTITVHVASGVTLTNEELWAEVTSPSELGSANSLGTINITRCPMLGTPTNLTTDSDSTWNGSGVGTKQKIEIPIDPTIPGLAVVRLYYAKASTTIYVDPKLEVA